MAGPAGSPETRDGFHAEISAPTLGVVAALFGLLLAFVIIVAYENFLETKADVSREADALAALVRDGAALQQPERLRVRDSVRNYARAVVNDEWAPDAQRRGEPTRGGSARCRL